MRPTLTASDLFSSRGRVDVLRVLWGVKVPLTAADVARRVRMTHPGATGILRSLVDYGLVSSSPAGRGHTYWLNRDDVYVDSMLDPVFAAEHEIPEEMLEALRLEFEGRGAISAMLFGSFARGDQDEDSDVDVMVVTPNLDSKARIERELPSIRDAFARTFGASLEVIAYDRDEARQLSDRAPELFDSVVRDGVCVFGLGVTEWGSRGAE